MVFHRNQAQFERARWRKALLLPLWILQVAMLLSLMGIFSYRLAETVEHFDEDKKKGKVPTVEFVWECTNIGLSVVALVLTVMEVAKLFSETLTPFFMLASHVVKMTCAFAILALDIVVYIDRSEGNWSIVGLAIDCGLLASMLSLGIYSIVKFRRLLAYDDYHHPANVKSFGFGNGYNEIEMSGGLGGGGGNDDFLRASPYNDLPTEYPPQGRGVTRVGGLGATGVSAVGGVIDAAGHSATRTRAGTGTRARALSAAESLRRLSIKSLTPSSPSNENANPFDDPGAGSSSSNRRASYNHERSTQFDDYIARAGAHAHHHLSKEDIDQAIGAELWGGGAGAGAVTGTVAGSRTSDGLRSNSLVGTGVVAAQTVQAGSVEDPGVVRKTSWTVEHVTPDMEGGPNNTIISPIVEAHEEDEEEKDETGALAAALGRGRNLTGAQAGEDRSLLLGHEQGGRASAGVSFDEDGEDDDDRVRPQAPGPEPDPTHKGQVVE